MFESETPLLWSPDDIFGSSEPYLRVRQPQNQQHQAGHLQQQLGISYESRFQGNILNVQSTVHECFIGQSMLNSFRDPRFFTMNQTEIGQRIRQGNIFAHPPMCYSHEFTNHLQEQVLQVPVIQQEVSSDAFGSLFPQHFHRFPDNNLPVMATANITTSLNRVHMQQQQHCLYAHTLSAREPVINNQFHNYYDLDQTVAVNTEHSSPIAQINLVLNRSQNYMSSQTYVPITSSFTMYGQQLSPSVLANQRNEAHSLRTVNNSARHHVIIQRREQQSSSSFQVSNLYTQLRRRPSANSSSSIPPQNEVVGSRRRSYQDRPEFGEPSSSTRRRMAVPADGSVGPTAINLAEQRREFGLYDPEYERFGLCVDPHLRNFLNQ